MTNPIGRKACPEVAKDMAAILKPAYRFGPAPKYTKVQRATGCGRRARALTLNPHPNPIQGGSRDRLAEEHREGRVAASGAKQRSHKLTWAPSMTVTLTPTRCQAPVARTPRTS